MSRKGYESFAVAQKQLALLLAFKLDDPVAAYSPALKARAAYPADPMVAKVLGVIMFKRNEPARAVRLLAECRQTLDSDTEAFFYLGMSHHQLNQSQQARAALQKALTLDANAPFAEQARRVLRELPQ